MSSLAECAYFASCHSLISSTGQLLMSSLCLCRMNARLKEIELNDDDSVKRFRLADGSTLEGDLYVSAMPGRIHICSAQPVSTLVMAAISQVLMFSSAVWARLSLDLLCFVHMFYSRTLAVPAHARHVCHHTSLTDMLGLCPPLLPQGLNQEQTHPPPSRPTSVSKKSLKNCHKTADNVDNRGRDQEKLTDCAFGCAQLM